MVVRELSQAPGVVLVEARSADGERRLLQIARFRAAEDESERGQRQAQERDIAQKTAELIGDPEVVVHAHGGADGESGERILFWALPYQEGPTLAGRTLSSEALIDVGIRLARRLVQRHEVGKLDPLLSEHLVTRSENGDLSVVGVPLAIDRGWVAPDMPPYRFAPEENGAPKESGDLFRLGVLLENLAGEGPPGPLAEIIRRMTDPDGRRFHTAAEALAALEALQALEAAQVSERNTEETEPTGPGEGTDVAAPMSGLWSLEVSDPALAISSEAVTKQAEPKTPIPTEEPRVVTITEPDRPVEPEPEPVVAAAGADDTAVIASYVVDVTGEAVPRNGATNGEATLDALDALAASWRQPVLPSGESPWSEVVEARGTHHRAKERFPGFSEEIPLPLADPPQPAKKVDARPVAVPVDDEIEEEVAAAISGFDAKKIVTAVLALLVIFGLFALIARSGGEEHALGAADVLEAPPTNELTLESEPPGATVVAETDGAILGKTPLAFLVARKSAASVFLTLPGYEPLRMTLPERGTIRARLTPVEADPCRVRLSALGAGRLQGIGFDLGDGEEVTLPGAGIVRAVDGPGVGARLVTCPSLGGRERAVFEFGPRTPPTAQVRITSPAGAAAYLDGEPIGRVPTVADAKRSFARIRVDGASGMSEERLVPSSRDVEVRMPSPKPRKMPVLVVPEERDESPVDLAPLEALEPSSDEYQAAVDAFEAGDMRLAKARFLRCLEAKPDDPLCHRGLGELYHRLRSPQKARQHYLRYLELVPDALDADRIRGQLER